MSFLNKLRKLLKKLLHRRTIPRIAIASNESEFRSVVLMVYRKSLYTVELLLKQNCSNLGSQLSVLGHGIRFGERPEECALRIYQAEVGTLGSEQQLDFLNIYFDPTRNHADNSLIAFCIAASATASNYEAVHWNNLYFFKLDHLQELLKNPKLNFATDLDAHIVEDFCNNYSE